MYVEIHLRGRDSIIKDIQSPSDVYLREVDPEPSGDCVILSIVIEGKYKDSLPGPFHKTRETSISMSFSMFQMVHIEVEKELDLVKSSPYEDLPLLISRMETVSGKRALEHRFQTGL